jgi:hypothetical protein
MKKKSDLEQTILDSAGLAPEQAVAFDLNLRSTKAYRERVDLQILHSGALLERMRGSQNLPDLWNISETQREMPSFANSLQLQENYARGLLLIVQKDSSTVVHQDSLDKLFTHTRFQDSLQIQRAITALLLESIANCQSPGQSRYLESQFLKLPNTDDPEIRKMVNAAKELTTKTTRQPVVKVDLNQKTPSLIRALGKFVGLGDYRMRVWLGGSPNFKHVVVRVAARNEDSARAAVQKFMDDFLEPDSVASREILDVFPPGSGWNSGRHPVLKL